MPCDFKLAIVWSSVVSRVVGAVADDDETGDRQAAQLVAGAVERVAEPRGRALEARSAVVCSRSATLEKRKTRGTKRCAERRQQRRVGAAEFVADEVAARLALLVADLHAPRIVDQDADEVLLRHRDLESSIGRSTANSATSSSRRGS